MCTYLCVCMFVCVSKGIISRNSPIESESLANPNLAGLAGRPITEAGIESEVRG